MLGVAHSDTRRDAESLAQKIVNLRIFEDTGDKFNLSAIDVRAELLVVSQFTLLADARKGRRPSFIEAAPPEQARELVDYFVDQISASGLRVATGQFQAHMLVNILNDGPVTIMLDSQEKLATN